MLYHLASHLSTLGERENEERKCEESENEESESEECDESVFEPLVKRPCSTRSGIMHQVSYSSSVSIFCRNEIKVRNYKSVQQHILISFSFSGIKWLGPPMLDFVFVGNFPQPPVNHSREK